MKKNLIVYIVGLLFWGAPLQAATRPPQFVSVSLQGQLGNQLFQIATAYAYSLDHNIPLIVPDLVHQNKWNIPYNAQKLFLKKILHGDLPRTPVVWNEPHFNYHSLPNSSRLLLVGYFQSEKYFRHRRPEILKLFAPPEELRQSILLKYPFLLSDKLCVGIQIRDYRREFPAGDHHPTFGRSYYEKAVALFPKDAIFLVSSNHSEFAQQCMEGLVENIIYLNGEDYIEEFYTLSLCQSFIISNSSFGWWAAWLSTAPGKTVVAPRPWFAPPYDESAMTDVFPPSCHIINN